jgi:hypothetical protein
LYDGHDKGKDERKMSEFCIHILFICR